MACLKEYLTSKLKAENIRNNGFKELLGSFINSLA